MLLQDFLHRSAARLPNKVALVCDGRRVTYRDIEVVSNQLANALRAKGVVRGDRVGVFLNNSFEAVVSVFGILKADAVFVVINHTTKTEKLAAILNNCRTAALIAEGNKHAVVNAMLAQVPSLRFSVLTGPWDQSSDEDAHCGFDRLVAEHGPDAPPRANIDLDLACLVYTSGSTGEPKGVMTDHGNAVFAATSISTYLENVEDDVVLNVLPLSFGYGLYQLLMTFGFGGTLVLERSCAYPATILRRIQEERVTGFPGVPTVFAVLLQCDVTSYDLSSLRYLSNAAAALPPSHVLRLQEKFPAVELYSMYGLTETKRALYLPPAELGRRPGSVGIAIPGTEVWLEDGAGHRLGPGQVGELVVRGRHVMRGYWEAPDATAARFRPGPIPGERLCYTGDLFSMDDEGYFYFVARKDEIIKSRGEKVAPAEVEKVLYSLDGVVEAAVMGVPDPLLGQAVKAVIVPNGIPLTKQIVIGHCKAYLEDFMVPKYVEFRGELPKTSSGKISRKGLT